MGQGARPVREEPLSDAGAAAAGASGSAHQRDELRALTRVAFDELGGAPGGIGQVHTAIAARVFSFMGEAAAPTRALHDGISRGVYAGLDGGAALLGLGVDAALGRRGSTSGRTLSTSPHGSLAIAVVQGLRGDTLEAQGSELCGPMCVRVDGEPTELDTPALAAAFPDAGRRLVVFLHGLMETEFAWRLGSGETGETYGSRLARDLGCTPVYLCYNSGRHISENGRSLAALLEELVEAWPVEVEEIALVGHSMGGLLARSACHRASGGGMGWVSSVTHVVSLGTPHLGAPLAQAVHLASSALSALPETRPLAGFLRRRSAGIRDLCNGSLVDEDWRGRDPDALRVAACEEIPLLEGATHCFVAATVTRSPRHPVGRLIGDWLVLESSASGRGRSRRIPFDAERGMHVGGTHHLALLNHPEVYERLREWLGGQVLHSST